VDRVGVFDAKLGSDLGVVLPALEPVFNGLTTRGGANNTRKAKAWRSKLRAA